MEKTQDIQNFYSHTLKILASKLNDELQQTFIHNTWGDGILAIFTDGDAAIRMMLKYRKFFQDYQITEDIKLIPRIAGHYGEMHIYTDPFLGNMNAIGRDINKTARIEPITRPGEIFVTKSFIDQVKDSPMVNTHIQYDPLGVRTLFKNGGKEELYLIRPISEEKSIIEKLHFNDNFIPKTPVLEEEGDPFIKLSDGEALIWDECNKSLKNRNYEDLINLIQVFVNEKINDCSGLLAFEIAKVCKKIGLYDEAITLIEKAQEWELKIDDNSDLIVKPFLNDKYILKLKADCLTRRDQGNDLHQAAEILYGLTINDPDSNTLSMLAAQLKRKAFSHSIGEEKIILLNKSLGFYLQAFQLDLEDYYPAINAAYLLIIISKLENNMEKLENGRLLAQYITRKWHSLKGSNWWIDSSIAQAELLQDHFEVAKELFEAALKKYEEKIDFFEIQTTLTQIEQYLTEIHDKSVITEFSGRDIIDLLSSNEIYVHGKKCLDVSPEDNNKIVEWFVNLEGVTHGKNK